MSTNTLEISNLSKSYGDFQLDNISFSLPKGYIMGLIGPNGSGKTTIIKIIMNLIIEERKEMFGKFVEERLPVLHEFAQDLKFENPHEILTNPKSFLAPIDQWLAPQQIDEEDVFKIVTKLGYFIGEYFAVEYNGCWSVCESKVSRYHGQYVVSQLSGFSNPAAQLNPLDAALKVVKMPKGRSLINVVKEIEISLNDL